MKVRMIGEQYPESRSGATWGRVTGRIRPCPAGAPVADGSGGPRAIGPPRAPRGRVECRRPPSRKEGRALPGYSGTPLAKRLGLAPPLGFVDVKVCAVSEVWSGLKLVIRRSERPAKRRPGA